MLKLRLCERALFVPCLHQCRYSEKIFFEIRSYKPETCENPYLVEFAAGLTEKYAERDILPEILGYFDFETAEYFYCQYYRMCRDDRFEDAAITYLNGHDLLEIRSQRILYALLDSYIPNDFIKPKPWCEIIAASDDLCCDLYLTTAKYYAMIGEYDLSDTIADKAAEIARGDEDRSRLLYFSPERILIRLEKQKADTLRYRTKKPYWPVTEERRRAVAMFYDEKGIQHPRIENKPVKVPENEFAPINECFDEMLTDYCTFIYFTKLFRRSSLFPHSHVKISSDRSHSRVPIRLEITGSNSF